MAVLKWDETGDRRYETGVDHGVLYLLNELTGTYDDGVAWNGLTTVTETPAGAEANPAYADNIKYLNLLSAETFGGTIEAFTYPDEYALCDGTIAPVPGLSVGQQDRKVFGLSYRTKVGSDVSSELGYKLHLIYGLLAAPSEKAYASVNDSPEAVTFSWDVTSTPVAVTGGKPTSLIVADSTMLPSSAMEDLEAFLYGTVGSDPSLPMPDDIIALFTGAVSEAVPTAPTFNAGPKTVTIPSVTGLEYLVAGKVVTDPYGPITKDVVVTCRPKTGYRLPDVAVDEWLIDFS